jgi:protoheme IX farnesyltransferase
MEYPAGDSRSTPSALADVMTAEVVAAANLWPRAALSPRLADWLALTKGRQTMLLLLTGLCSYVLTRGAQVRLWEAVGMAAGLLLSISGCTVLNMVLDRDLDARMSRTADRPLPAGRIETRQALAFGGTLAAVGLCIALQLDSGFGALVGLGLVFDLLVYTVWLKRRTAMSIFFGGVAGGMPPLAGRVLALGRIDAVGLLLAASVLLWIPSHILTLAMRYARDYERADVPVWPNVYGLANTRLLIATASLLNTVILAASGILLAMPPMLLAILLAASLVMAGLSALQVIKPSEERNWLLFKLASCYMLVAMLLLTIGGLARS